MKRSVEFDLVTKSEANRRGNSKLAQIIHAKHVAAQRAAVRAVLNSTFGAPPPLHVVQTQREPPVFGPLGEMGLTHRNKFAITLTRICVGKLDDDNLASALKAVRDEVAAWCDVPNDRDPIYTWTRAEQEAEQHVYRVKIEIVDMLTAPDKIVTLREGESAGRAAASKVKRAINKQIKAHAPTALVWPASKRCPFWIEKGNYCPKHGATCTTVLRAKAVMKPDGDPGEELSPQRLKPCPRFSCMAALDLPCKRDGTQDESFAYGVHVERAAAAGVHVRNGGQKNINGTWEHGYPPTYERKPIDRNTGASILATGPKGQRVLALDRAKRPEGIRPGGADDRREAASARGAPNGVGIDGRANSTRPASATRMRQSDLCSPGGGTCAPRDEAAKHGRDGLARSGGEAEREADSGDRASHSLVARKGVHLGAKVWRGPDNDLRHPKRPKLEGRQADLVFIRSWIALPWEQKTCDACGGAGILAPDGVEPWSCSTCKGTGRSGPYTLTAFPRFDGVDMPPPSIEAPIPPEHAQRFAGPTITLTRRRFNSAATGVCWLYERTTERS